MINVADRLAIHELLGLYGHIIDERRWSQMEPNIVITEDPDGTVRVLSKGIGPSAKGRVGSGVYRDIVAKSDAGWRLRYRRAELRRPT